MNKQQAQAFVRSDILFSYQCKQSLSREDISKINMQKEKWNASWSEEI